METPGPKIIYQRMLKLIKTYLIRIEIVERRKGGGKREREGGIKVVSKIQQQHFHFGC